MISTGFALHLLEDEEGSDFETGKRSILLFDRCSLVSLNFILTDRVPLPTEFLICIFFQRKRIA